MSNNLTLNEDLRFFEDNKYEVSPTKNQLYMLCRTLRSLKDLVKEQKISLELADSMIELQKEQIERYKNKYGKL